MKTKFTPGPWAYFYKHKYDAHHVGIPVMGSSLKLALFPDGCPGENPEHDARLISAAPDLYAVLDELEESCEYWSEYDVPLGIVDRIKAALKKARGE